MSDAGGNAAPIATRVPRDMTGGAGLWSGAWRRLTRNRAARGAALLVATLLVVSIIGPWIRPYGIETVDWSLSPLSTPPSIATGHWFGTDANGRDLFVRVWAGTQVSLAIALLATAVSILIGVAWGATAGYVGGRVDDWMMRFVDVLYALPYMFFVIILTVVFGRSLMLIFLAIGAVGWLTMARIVRGQALALRHREFVDAAIALGLPTHRIVARHIVPNVLGTVVVYAALTIPQLILFESFLSFLGLGVQEPLTSLGRLVAEGALEIETAPWQLLLPSSVLALLLLGLNFLGDGLRDALDPRQGGT
jgi:oligopeptide transport system permease protein